ncbi:MAG: hypothetical protein EAX96_21340, partial [Candidatus Lokiarchaeota archaeon]|nr:hypothetical protein [Candidatus Lokiarchaeota archaeon]
MNLSTKIILLLISIGTFCSPVIADTYYFNFDHSVTCCENWRFGRLEEWRNTSSMEILGHHASCNDEWSSFGVNEYIYEFHIYRLIGLFHTQNIKNIPIEQAYVRLYLAYPDWARTLYGNYDSLQIQLYEADWGSEFDLDEDFDCMTSLLSEGTYIPSLEN